MAHKLQPKKQLGFFDRTIKQNVKYSHIASTLSTGLTVSKVKNVTANEGAKRRAEIFFRLTPGQLCALYEEYESNENEDVREMGRGCYADDYGGKGGPKIVTYDEVSQAVNSKPYLILDVREPEAYNTGHLLQARSFPYTHLRRDAVAPEFYQFRNKTEALIILYCDDERVSRDAAKLMVDRGTDNIFLLSGGMNEFATEYPFLVEGAAPKSASPAKRSGLTRSGECVVALLSFALPFSHHGHVVSPSPPALARIAEDEVLPASRLAPYLTSPSAPRQFTHRSPVSTKQDSRLGGDRRFSGRDDKTEGGYSTASNRSVAESVIQRAASRKGRF